MSRLRPLTESECYTRLYGDREPTVAVIRESEPERPSGGRLGDAARRAFEESLGIERQEDSEAEAA